MEKVLGAFIGLIAMACAVANGNLDVGRVTVKHMCFSVILMLEVAGKHEWAIKVYSYLFGVGIREYVSPVKEDYVDGIRTLYVDESCVDSTLHQASIGVREADVVKVVSDFIAYGRMFQEWTIDSAKKGFAVDIPYIDKVGLIKPLSREDNVADVKVLWTAADRLRKPENGYARECKVRDESRVEFTHSGMAIRVSSRAKQIFRYPAEAGKKLGKLFGYETVVRVGKDFFRKLNVVDPYLEIIAGLQEKLRSFAAELAVIEPKLPGGIRSTMEKRLILDNNFKVMAHLMVFYKNSYRAISSYRAERLKAVNAAIKDRKELQSAKRLINARIHELVRSLSNEVRRARVILAKNGIEVTDENFILSAIASCFYSYDSKDMKWRPVAEEAAVSAFADTVLPQEFAQYMRSALSNSGFSVPLFTEDKLEICYGFSNGDSVYFDNGVAEVIDEVSGKTRAYAYTSDMTVSGQFIIRDIGETDAEGKAHHCWVASQNLNDKFSVPETDLSKMVLMTSAKELNPARILSAVFGESITTVTKENGTRVNQFCGAGVTAKYRVPSIPTGMSGNVIKALEELFGGYTGTVTDGFSVSTQDENGKSMKVGLIVLSEVEVKGEDGVSKEASDLLSALNL